MLELAESEGREVELNAAEENAMKALRAGSSFAQAAKLSGVNRGTVYRWVEKNPAFRAAYNGWQKELTESGRARLLRLTDRAVDVLERALADDDRKVAVKMLRELGVMRGRKHGSTDAEVLQSQMELQRKQEHREAIPDRPARDGTSPAAHVAAGATTGAARSETEGDDAIDPTEVAGDNELSSLGMPSIEAIMADAMAGATDPATIEGLSRDSAIERVA